MELTHAIWIILLPAFGTLWAGKYFVILHSVSYRGVNTAMTDISNSNEAKSTDDGSTN